MRSLLLSFLLLAAAFVTEAQPPCSTFPGMTPQTAIAVCGTTIFRQNAVNNCQNTPVNPPPCPDGLLTERSFWYKFHCYAPGTLGLGFLITPDMASDDFDWALFDVTGHPNLNDIYSDPTMHVSSNISGDLGVTGCTPAGIGNVNCPADPRYNRLATLQTGHDYMLMVTNWTPQPNPLGYTLNFTGGDAVITDPTVPVISNVATIGCNTSLLKVTFSKDIVCSSVTASGSEFSITPGTPAITSVVAQCPTAFSTITELTIQLQNPLAAGNYNLLVNPGSDANTFTDVCGNNMATGFSIPFTVTAIPPAQVTSVNYTGCAPTVLNVALTKPVWCTSVTPSGSEFSILPGNPAILSVQSTCGTGPNYIDQLQIVLQNPLANGNYQLVVNNGADGNTLIDTCNNSIAPGYNFPFTITQLTTPPVIQTVVFDECHPDKLVLNFDKPVACNTITAAGSELSVSPGVWPLNSITYNCTAGTYTSQITMNLANPLPAGNFNVVVGTGTDGNTLADTCFAFMPVGYTKAFVTTQAPAPIFDSVQFDNCNANYVRVFYSHPILCSSISANGSDFSITGPSAVNITGATADVTCGTVGYTRWVRLQLAAPINPAGNYVLHNGIGSDGNGIIDTCNARQNVNETIAVNVLGKPSAVFTGQVNWGCVNDTIVLSHPGGNGANSWNWSFSDGRTATGQNVSMSFPVATPTVTVRLIVSNSSCSDTTTQTFTLGNVFNAAFSSSPGDTICINTPINFTDASTGTISNYLWDFGDLTQFNGQNPPTHIYPVANIYNVQLIVTDNHGCKDTASRQLHVDASALIDFTGLKPQYCTGNIVSLQRVISRNVLSYVWDNGDGKTFINEVDVTFSYPNEGVYTITLSGIDKYCGPASISKTVPVYAVPRVNLGPDTVLCGSDRILIGVQPSPNYTYLWNTGETTSQIYTMAFFNIDYSLTADNHGCKGKDAMHVKVLPFCLIKVPNAFTPNNDGLNDELKALNADLAKDFSFKVYNRFGQLIFSTTNPLDGWDGKLKGNPAESGTYVWILSYIDPWTGNAVKEKGTSILIR